MLRAGIERTYQINKKAAPAFAGAAEKYIGLEKISYFTT